MLILNHYSSMSALKISLLAGAALAGVSPALAQSEATSQPGNAPARNQQVVALPTQADQEELHGDIVVTGSLVARDGFNMPTPVTVIGETDLARVGSADISDVVNQIPSIKASMTNDSTATQSSAAGGTFADLRGFGSQRTLILLDGRRMAATNGSGAVSTASLPQAAIGGVDVVTGGASATYGSDAVAGVVNYKINDRLNGFRGRIQGGISDYGDYENYLVSAAFGTPLLGGRARLIVAGEMADNRGIDRIGDRPWADNVGTINNPAYTLENNEPRLLIMRGVKSANRTDGGIILTPSSLAGLHFLPDGSAVPMAYGTYRTASTMVGGDGADTSSKTTASVPQNRRSVFARLAFDISDSFWFSVEGNYARLKSKFDNVAGTEVLTIKQDNPFLPQSIRDVMLGQNIPSITIGRTFDDNRREIRNLYVETKRFVAAMGGDFGSTWNWNAYYSGGTTDNTSDRMNSRVVSKFNLAIDAVANPANGAIVCRSTLTDPTNGCVPINLIGEGRASEEALRYTNADGVHNQYVTQHVIAATIRGEPISTWAGPIGVAVGAERKWLSLVATSDDLSNNFLFAAGGYKGWAGKVDVNEAFGEILVPLAKDTNWANDLSLNLAGRATDYSTSGLVYSWKAGLSYAPTNSLRFRVTRSRDIRAPSLEDLFYGGSTLASSVEDPILGETYSTTVESAGNPLLKPERADTTTAGVIFSPEFAPGLKMSLDYWDIKLDDAIASLSAGVLVRQCYEEDNAAACLLIRRAGSSPTDKIQYITVAPINFEEMSARGFDFEMSYQTNLGQGKLDLRAMGTYFARGLVTSNETGTRELHDSVQQGGPKAIGGSPRWKVNTRVTYSQGGGFVSLGTRYTDGGRINPEYTAKDINILRSKGRIYFDLSAEYPLLKKGEGSVALFGSVRNLLNTDPPLGGSVRTFYDVIGRLYNAGVKFRF